MTDLPPSSTPTVTRLGARRFSFACWGSSAALALLAVVGFYTLVRVAEHNSGVVAPGELYRAAQLNDPELKTAIDTLRLKSVLNLRGPNPQAGWYQHEITLCRQQGVVHADVRLSAKHLPPPDQMAALLNDFRTLPRPILVHCYSGSDRTGLVSAVYLIDQKDYPVGQASRELSLHYGHFALFPYFPMNEFLDLYRSENPQGRSLHDWVLHDYPNLYAGEQKAETTWDKVIDPFEAMAGIAYWRHDGRALAPLDH